jgi:hypothetical protein
MQTGIVKHWMQHTKALVKSAKSRLSACCQLQKKRGLCKSKLYVNDGSVESSPFARHLPEMMRDGQYVNCAGTCQYIFASSVTLLSVAIAYGNY